MKIPAFPEGIRLKVNLIPRLEFELTYNDFAVKPFSHYTTETRSEELWCSEQYFN